MVRLTLVKRVWLAEEVFDFQSSQTICGESCSPRCYLCILPLEKDTLIRTWGNGEYLCRIYRLEGKVTRRTCLWCHEAFEEGHLRSHLESFPFEPNVGEWLRILPALQREIQREVLRLKRRLAEWEVWGFTNWRCVDCPVPNERRCALRESPVRKVRCIRSVGLSPEMLGVPNDPRYGYVIYRAKRELFS